jgi:hypothetical protein
MGVHHHRRALPQAAGRARPWPRAMRRQHLPLPVAPFAAIARAIGCLVWQPVRVAVLSILLTFEPWISVLLSTFAFLGTLTAFVMEFSGVPDFPFWLVFGFAVGCTLMRILYARAIHALAK